MDKVLTIDDWWDGPVIGLTTYNGMICIYFRIFDIQIDEYCGDYFLTPIDDSEAKMIMEEWNEWCMACSKNELDLFYKKHLNDHSIKKILETSNERNKDRKKAVFAGSIGQGWIPLDYHVEWYD